MITQLAHLNLFTDRHQEMLKFYTDALGLKIQFTLDNNEGVPFGWYLACGKMTFIEIFDQAGAVRQWGGKVTELQHGSKFRHLCFDVKDLEAYREMLVRKKNTCFGNHSRNGSLQTSMGQRSRWQRHRTYGIHTRKFSGSYKIAGESKKWNICSLRRYG
jgi:catechol 2,3-dioxygenase-like lactoylglutathione lyase family enzyme